MFYVTIDDVSVIYLTAQRCAGGLKKKFELSILLEAKFIQYSLGEKEIASRLNFTYRYIDVVLSINPDSKNYLDQMFPVVLEIKDTTEGDTSAAYLDSLL